MNRSLNKKSLVAIALGIALLFSSCETIQTVENPVEPINSTVTTNISTTVESASSNSTINTTGSTTKTETKTTASSTSTSASTTTSTIEDKDTLKVFFIGNSLTYFPEIPEQLAVIAKSKNKKIKCTSYCVGNYTLEDHWKGVAHDEIKVNKFDYVVLQEHGLPPVADIDNFIKYAKLFNDEIKATGAKTILYITSRSANDQGLAVDERQHDLTLAYEKAAKEIGAILAPSGPSWVAANKGNDKLRFYDIDNMHPNVLGGYLTACVFYSVIYNESPLGADWSNIKYVLNLYCKDKNEKESLVKYLQNTAWDTCKNYKPILDDKTTTATYPLTYTTAVCD